MADIPTFYPTEFQRNFDQVLQQMDTRLLGSITRADFTGKRKWFNLIDAGSATDITTRKGDTPDGDFSGSKYWLFQRAKERVTVFDEFDEKLLGQIVLPTSDEVQSHAMSFNRATDDVIISAFDATRYIGEDGTDTDAFPSSQSIAANYVESGSAVSSGLTIAKLRRAKYLFDYNEVPMDGRYIAVGAQQLQDLLRTAEITNDNYNTVKALVQGEVDTFLGFKFISTQRLPIDGSDIRSVFAWHNKGIKFSMAERKTRMDILPNRRHALQIRSTMLLGAVRTENKRVVRIYCDETP